MNRLHEMTQLKDRLDDASLAADWTALAGADRLLAIALPRWRSAGALNSVEHVAFARLRQSHRAALEHCTRQSDELALQLQEMNQHKDGWLAYAATGDWEEHPA